MWPLSEKLGLKNKKTFYITYHITYGIQERPQISDTRRLASTNQNSFVLKWNYCVLSVGFQSKTDTKRQYVSRVACYPTSQLLLSPLQLQIITQRTKGVMTLNKCVSD